jgi:molybdate transport system permease protein
VNPALEQMARTLGAGEWRVFFTITLPLAKRGLLAGTLLAFARALGEFGATIMVAGNIPGVTTTLSTDIYQLVQLGEDSHAWTLAGISLALAFAALGASEWLMRGRKH